MMMSPQLSASVQRRIDELDPTRADEPTARICKELNALPLYSDGLALWALVPDGTVLRLACEASEQPPEPESDPVLIHRAVVHGSRRYRELLDLLPSVREPLMPNYSAGKRAGMGPDEMRQALKERRVVVKRVGPPVMGDQDVWYSIPEPGDFYSSWALRGTWFVFNQPVTERDLRDDCKAKYFWPAASPAESRYMKHWLSYGGFYMPVFTSPDSCVRFERAVALFLAKLLDLLPYEIAARAGTYVEILRTYAAAPSRELARRVAACARATGFECASFDLEREWERDDRSTAAVAKWLHETLPRCLGEYVRGAGSGSDAWIHADDAERWLGATIVAWSVDALWDIGAGADPLIPTFEDDAIPGFLLANRTLTVQGWPLEMFVSELDAQQTDALRRFCVGPMLASRLRAHPAASEELSRLLAVANGWAHEPWSEVTAKAGELADDAARAGGDALFAAPFRLMTVEEPAEIVSRTLEAERELVVAWFRALTYGIEVAESVEQVVGEKAVAALTEVLRRFVRGCQSGVEWKYEPKNRRAEGEPTYGSLSEPPPLAPIGVFREVPSPAPSVQPHSPSATELIAAPVVKIWQPRHCQCSICLHLDDYEFAVQTMGGRPDDTFLPEAAEKLEVEHDIRSGHPGLRLKRCPECGTFYLYHSIYEFNYGGSWDEYTLTRLTDEVAMDYYEGRRSKPL